MQENDLENLAKKLHSARLNARPVEQLSKNHSGLTYDYAYSIQEKLMQYRESSGEKISGFKMGLTSEAKRKQMNLDSPLYGFLTDKMLIKSGGAFSLNGSIHPKIEPEVAFLISSDLKWPVSRNDVLNACSGVAPCMEIIDSRYTEFKYFSMEDVISDNSSSSHFVLGEWETNFKNKDLLNMKMQMFVDDVLVQSGISSDISGDPVMSVVDLCRMLNSRKKILKAGSIVLAGAATPAVELKPKMQIQLKMDGFSAVNVSVNS